MHNSHVQASSLESTSTNVFHQNILSTTLNLTQPQDNRIRVLGLFSFNNNDQNRDQIPTQFKSGIKITRSYFTEIQSIHKQYVEKIIQSPYDFKLRYQLAENSLKMAELCKNLLMTATIPAKIEEHKKNEKNFINKAKWEIQQAKNIDDLNPLYFYLESMIEEYEGVDCKNLCQVEKYIQYLTTALAIDPNSIVIKQKLDEIVLFLKIRWKELVEENMIDSSTHLHWTQELDKFLSIDPLKNLFVLNPQFFKYSSRIEYASFFNQHPELKNIKAFEAKYSDIGSINLIDGLNQESVRKTLALVEDHPLAKKLPLISETALLTPVVANEIKEGMLKYFEKNKILRVYVGNKDDMETIVHSFTNDKSYVKGSVSVEELAMKGFSHRIYAVFITSDDPFKKA